MRLALLLALLALSHPAQACDALVLAFEPGTTDEWAWRRGHVIAVQEEGYVWGSAETLPKFWHIIVTGATREQCLTYMVGAFDANGNPIRLRGKKLDYNTLSTPQKRALDNNGTLSVTKAQADAYFAVQP